MDFLSIEDLFAFGLGLDVAGAYLLSRGLLARPSDIVRQATGFWNYSPATAVAMAHDRARSTTGLVSLLAGFLVQAATYVAILAGADMTDSFGCREAMAAAAAALLPAVGVPLGESVTHTSRTKRILVEVAHHEYREDRVHRMPMPSGPKLVALGKQLEVEPGQDEDHASYAKRVFGVTEVGDWGS